MDLRWPLYMFFVSLLVLLPEARYLALTKFVGPILRVLRWQRQRPEHLFIEGINDFISVRKYQTGAKDLKTPTLPEYKFYTKLIYDLWGHSRQFGGPIFQHIEEIKRGVYKDAQFEKKVGKEVSKTLLQLLFLAGLTWLFIMVSQWSTDIQVGSWVIGGMGVVHLLGGVVMWMAQRSLKRRTFSSFEEHFRTFYTFSSLIAVGVPLNVALGRSGVSAHLECEWRGLNYLKQRAWAILQRLQKTGAPVSEDLRSLIDDLWFEQEETFSTYLQHLVALKFMVMVFFYVVPYFLYLFTLFGPLLGHL